MTTARQDQAATLLPDGRVLITGGRRPQGDGTTSGLASAELYDPATGTFGATGSMAAGRNGHSATLLQDGRVLVAGGSDGSTVLTSAELYDPKTGVFVSTGPMAAAHFGAPATLLPDGRVLIVGSSGPSADLPSAELYRP